MSDTRIRFFRLVKDKQWGLQLHQADLAINKVLAASSRRKARDFADIVAISSAGRGACDHVEVIGDRGSAKISPVVSGGCVRCRPARHFSSSPGLLRQLPIRRLTASCTNSGVVVVRTDPLKSRLDLWQRKWDPAQTAKSVTPTVEPAAGVPVTLGNFIRAETDFYFKTREFGKLNHSRDIAPIDKQDVVRMNRDTLYSSGVFDLEAGPVTITLPDAGKRFMSMQVISQDHYTTEVVYGPGRLSGAGKESAKRRL
jgi:hypothetical protein